MGLETFERVYHIGIAIEDDLLKEGNNKNVRWNNNKKSDNAAGSSKTVSALNTTERPPFRRQRREYTPLGMTYTKAFDRLKGQGLLNPIGPTPDPTPGNRSQR